MTLSPAQLEHSTLRLLAHSTTQCAPPCPLHHRTDHHMRLFPQNWRSDRYMMERICPHGIGHPDPDDHFTQTRIHGCDGCCRVPSTLSTPAE